MDSAHGYDDLRQDDDPTEGGVGEATAPVGGDERRMHVRAYNHWVSLLRGRPYPAIDDLEPEGIADFGPNSVLLDFSAGVEDPTIQFIGRALREECGLDQSILHISDVPSRSLLSRLTDHYLQIIANRAPIGFEAEFVNTRGHNTMYRGILMPFSSDDDTIDFIYGVINWKEVVDAETQAQLEAEVAQAVRQAPRMPVTAPAWASGPSAAMAPVSDEVDAHYAGDGASALPLADQLTLAQQSAAAVRAADTRSRAALYRALGRAYDFAVATAADPAGYARLLEAAQLTVQDRAPMTPIVKLVFGVDYDKTRVTEFATVLTHARRTNVPAGALPDFLDLVEGGIKGVVQAERALRKPAVGAPTRTDRARSKLAQRAALASVDVASDAVTGEYVVLVARRSDHGRLDIVAALAADDPLTDRAVVRAAR